MNTRLRGVASTVAFLVLVAIAGAYGTRFLDQMLVALVSAIYIAGSAVLVFKACGSRPEDRRRLFYGGVLALLPESWRRWCLDEAPTVGPKADKSGF